MKHTINGHKILNIKIQRFFTLLDFEIEFIRNHFYTQAHCVSCGVYNQNDIPPYLSEINKTNQN